jgi:hypothetical protein
MEGPFRPSLAVGNEVEVVVDMLRRLESACSVGKVFVGLKFVGPACTLTMTIIWYIHHLELYMHACIVCIYICQRKKGILLGGGRGASSPVRVEVVAEADLMPASFVTSPALVTDYQSNKRGNPLCNSYSTRPGEEEAFTPHIQDDRQVQMGVVSAFDRSFQG